MISTPLKRKFLGIICMLVPIAVWAQENHSETNTLTSASYAISYPTTWELSENGAMGTTFILLSQQESPSDAFRENVNLVVQDLTGYNLDLDAYTKLSVEQIRSLITNAKIIESKKVESGTPHQQLIYTGDQGSFQLKFEQIYFVVKEKAYVLTFTAEQKSFDQFKDTAEKILGSFTLK